MNWTEAEQRCRETVSCYGTILFNHSHATLRTLLSVYDRTTLNPSTIDVEESWEMANTSFPAKVEKRAQ